MILGASLFLTGCGRNMYDQPRYDPLERSNLPQFQDGSSARPLLEGTVSRNRGALPISFLTGQDENGRPMTDLPFPVTAEVLQRGQERYNIYCAPCHNYNGDAQGIIVQKGFPQPASFHEPRLQNAEVGYFFNVMTNGFGRMYPYAARIQPEDRWAIAGYIRALQLSQQATADDIPEGMPLGTDGAGPTEGGH
jgi:cytochrome c553